MNYSIFFSQTLRVHELECLNHNLLISENLKQKVQDSENRERDIRDNYTTRAAQFEQQLESLVYERDALRDRNQQLVDRIDKLKEEVVNVKEKDTAHLLQKEQEWKEKEETLRMDHKERLAEMDKAHAEERARLYQEREEREKRIIDEQKQKDREERERRKKRRNRRKMKESQKESRQNGPSIMSLTSGLGSSTLMTLSSSSLEDSLSSSSSSSSSTSSTYKSLPKANKRPSSSLSGSKYRKKLQVQSIFDSVRYQTFSWKNR